MENMAEGSGFPKAIFVYLRKEATEFFSHRGHRGHRENKIIYTVIPAKAGIQEVLPQRAHPCLRLAGTGRTQR
jgi:hypothetical protein